MSFTIGSAGESVRHLADRRYIGRLKWGLACLAVIIAVVLILPGYKSIGAFITFAVFMAMRIILEAADNKADEIIMPERLEAKGAPEEEVGEILRKLPGDYAVFHDIETPYGVIDHVVLNKKNIVFLIETKSHHGTLTWDGQSLLLDAREPEKDFTGQTVRNLHWLKDRVRKETGFELYIHAVLVFTDASVKVWSPVKGVNFRDKKYLTDFMEQRVKSLGEVRAEGDMTKLFLILRGLEKRGR